MIAATIATSINVYPANGCFKSCLVQVHQTIVRQRGGNKLNRDGPPVGGLAATPLTVSGDVPEAIASNWIAASRPDPDAPTASPGRTNVKSIRPVAASVFGVNTTLALPWRRKLPSCTVRILRIDGLNVTVTVTVEAREMPAT